MSFTKRKKSRESFCQLGIDKRLFQFFMQSPPFYCSIILSTHSGGSVLKHSNWEKVGGLVRNLMLKSDWILLT